MLRVLVLKFVYVSSLLTIDQYGLQILNFELHLAFLIFFIYLIYRPI